MLHNNIKCDDLPLDIRGTYKFNVSLKEMSFFKVGGICDVFFIPKDIDDLSYFLQNKPDNLKILCLGNMSNVLINDDGFRGCIVYLRDTFNNIFFDNIKNNVFVESGVSLQGFIKKCADQGISCLEKLMCIPGTIGGALKMNAGIPNCEISDFLESITLINIHNGIIENIQKKDLKMEYRNSNISDDYIITSCILKTQVSSKEILHQEISDLTKKRISTQPIGQATCGSTFKNPKGFKAWELIKNAGCVGFQVGDAKISDLHCNFIVNQGNANASDILSLINIVKQKVFENSGILLEEEIKIIY